MVDAGRHTCACSVVQSLSRVQLFMTPWTHQAPLSMGILQARILEWVAISFSMGSSPPRDQTHVSWAPAMAGKFFTTESTGNPTPMFFLLDTFSSRAIKWPRDVATYTEYTTVKTCTGVSVSWGSPRPSHITTKEIPECTGKMKV